MTGGAGVSDQPPRVPSRAGPRVRRGATLRARRARPRLTPRLLLLSTWPHRRRHLSGRRAIAPGRGRRRPVAAGGRASSQASRAWVRDWVTSVCSGVTPMPWPGPRGRGPRGQGPRSGAGVARPAWPGPRGRGQARAGGGVGGPGTRRGGGRAPGGFSLSAGGGSVSQSRVHSRPAAQHFCARRTGPMVAGRKNRRSLRIVALVAAAGPAVALVTACSATGGTAARGRRAGAPGHRPGARRRPRRGRPGRGGEPDRRHALRCARAPHWSGLNWRRDSRPGGRLRLPAPRPPPPQPARPPARPRRPGLTW